MGKGTDQRVTCPKKIQNGGSGISQDMMSFWGAVLNVRWDKTIAKLPEE